MLPRGSDELGLANAMLALVVGLVAGAAFLCIGLFQSIRAIVRARGTFRWYDYLILVLGVAPVVVVVVILPFVPLP